MSQPFITIMLRRSHLNRVPEEGEQYMPEIKLAHKAPAMSEEQIDHFLQEFANGFGQQLRSPVMHSPSEQGLDYQDVSFPSLDGTPLEGWFIPAKGSNKLIINNHPMGFSRSGLPTQLEPWKSMWGSSGNNFEINLIPDYKILHDAGYNVLTYDLRNFGLSGSANGGIGSSGIFESRDVLGSLKYARSREDTRHMVLGLFSRCLGCNSTLYAMKSDPKAFDGVRCLVGPQPVDTKTIVTQQLSLSGIPANSIDDLDRRIIRKTGIGFDRRNQQAWAKAYAFRLFFIRCMTTYLRRRVMCRPRSITFLLPTRNSCGSRARQSAGTDMHTFNGNPSRRWIGSKRTCPDRLLSRCPVASCESVWTRSRSMRCVQRAVRSIEEMIYFAGRLRCYVSNFK